MEEYEQQANNFLKKTNVSFKAEFVAFKKYFADDEQERAVFNITLQRGERKINFLFGQSIAESGFCFPKYSKQINKQLLNESFGCCVIPKVFLEKGEVLRAKEHFLKNAQKHFGSIANMEYFKFQYPTAYDVLSGLTKYEVGTFKDFCNDYGYSDDSIKAERTYKDVLKEWDNVQKIWTDEEILKLQEIN